MTRRYELTAREISVLHDIANGSCVDWEDADIAESLADMGLVELGYDERSSVGASEPDTASLEGEYVTEASSDYESWRGSGICVFIPEGELDSFSRFRCTW